MDFILFLMTSFFFLSMRWFTKLGAKGVAGTGSQWEFKEEKKKEREKRETVIYRLAIPAIT